MIRDNGVGTKPYTATQQVLLGESFHDLLREAILLDVEEVEIAARNLIETLKRLRRDLGDDGY